MMKGTLRKAAQYSYINKKKSDAWVARQLSI